MNTVNSGFREASRSKAEAKSHWILWASALYRNGGIQREAGQISPCVNQVVAEWSQLGKREAGMPAGDLDRVTVKDGHGQASTWG